MALPIIISTWPFALRANEAAFAALVQGGSALDAVEQGVRTIEDDPGVSSVGYGGLPDESMEVTLDASIMDGNGNCGAVAALSGVRNAVSVARAVMEDGRHVMLAGDGALAFAESHGFARSELLTARSRSEWERWRRTADAEKASTPPEPWSGPRGDHDTVGMLALDAAGRLCGAVSTSGTAFKLRGRVGDSPIIGAGLYVDGAVGAAAATGVGEEGIRIVAAHLIVEEMRRGATPAEACATAVKRAAVLRPRVAAEQTFQLAFIALDREGRSGAAAMRRGFRYALHREGHNALYSPAFTYYG